LKALDDEQKDWFLKMVANVREQFEREIDQGILKRDLYQSVEAMGGRDACDRIKRAFSYYDTAEQANNLRQLEVVKHASTRRGRIK